MSGTMAARSRKLSLKEYETDSISDKRLMSGDHGVSLKVST